MEAVTARKQLNGLTRVDMEEYFDDVEVDSLYQWIDRIPLSRPKKNISKDFSDAVLCGEIVKHYFPRMVELHNYTPAASTKQKLENWYLLNRRVLRRLDLDLSDDVLRALANCKPKVIERVLMLLRLQIDKMLEKTGRDDSWRHRELYHSNPETAIRLPLHTPPSYPYTPPDIKSPHGADASTRSLSPQNRLSKSEPSSSPRRYAKGEVPHGHPERSSYFADKPLPMIPVHKSYVPPIADNIPRIFYDEKEMECQAKEETIQILNAKIRRLEHLIHLKDVRIEDLHSTLQQTLGMGYTLTRKR